MHNLLTWEDLWFCFHSLCFYICLPEQFRLREGVFIFNIDKVLQALSLSEFLKIVGKLTLLYSNYWALLMCSGIPCYWSSLCPLVLHTLCVCVLTQPGKLTRTVTKVLTQFNKRMVAISHQRSGFSLVSYTKCFSHSLRKIAFFKFLKSPSKPPFLCLVGAIFTGASVVSWQRGWYTHRSLLKFPELNKKYLHWL